MVMKVTIYEAKTNLCKLIAAVEAGEEVVIARRHKPVVRLVKEVVKKDLEKDLEKKSTPKRSLGFGCGKGMFSEEVIDYLTDNPELDTEIEDAFEKAVADE